MEKRMKEKLHAAYEVTGMATAGGISIGVLVDWIETGLGIVLLAATLLWTYYKIKGARLDNQLKEKELGDG